MQIEIAAPAADELGECPVWLPDTQQLLRVDINAPAIILRDAGSERRRTVAGPVGFALPAAGGAIVAGIGRELVSLETLDAAPQVIAEVERGRTDNRFNDAACDPRGRLWAGTMSTTRIPGTAALYRLEPGGVPEVALPGGTISNGLDFNLDATRLYYIDSPAQRIDAIDFDVDRGRLGTRRPFVRIAPEDGLPDGLCVDADGGIWIALFGGGALRRYTPEGTLDAHIRLPVTNPTCPAFGGADLSTLYVTSARHRLAAPGPLDGSLLRLRPGVSGRPAHAFG
jgi:sugar lactone lactonase YvrE